MDFKDIANENRILEVRVGSHLFGTETEDSDLDLFGVFMPSKEMCFGFQVCNEVDLGIKSKDDTGRNTKDAVDRKLHEYRKFARLAMQNNPNILHLLWADEKNIIFKDEEGFADRLFEQAHLFPSQAAYHRFAAYAYSQKHKMLIKPKNYAELERGLEILENADDNMVMAEMKDVSPFKYEGKGKHVQLGDISFEAGVYVKKARKMARRRLDNATSRHVLFSKHGFDSKFGANLIQLLMEGIELMNTGRVQFPLAYAHDILDIKNGKYTADEVVEWSEGLAKNARIAYEKTSLPAKPDAGKIEEFVIGEVSHFLQLRRQL